MKRNLISYSLSSLLILLIMLIVIFVIPAHSQERKDIYRSKSFFMEFGGSGVAVLTGNYDFRFFKGRNDGIGMRIGIGGESSNSKPLFGDGEIKIKLISMILTITVAVASVIGVAITGLYPGIIVFLLLTLIPIASNFYAKIIIGKSNVFQRNYYITLIVTNLLTMLVVLWMTFVILVDRVFSIIL